LEQKTPEEERRGEEEKRRAEIWAVLHREDEKKYHPSHVALILVFLLPLLITLFYGAFKAGGFGDFFRNFSDLGWPGMTALIVKVIFNYIFWLLATYLGWLVIRPKVTTGTRVFAGIVALLIAGILTKVPYFGVSGSDKMPLGFAVVEPKDYRYFGVPDSLDLARQMPQLNNYLTTRLDGRLQSRMTVTCNEIYAVVLEGSVISPILPHFWRQLNIKTTADRMYFPSGPFVWPKQIRVGQKCLVQNAPYASPVISVRHESGQIYNWQTAFVPGQPYLIVRALRSGELVATLNLPASQGFGRKINYWATRESTKPHVRLLVYRIK
jgi:hypothetical protein